jgi:hypothetical protein
MNFLTNILKAKSECVVNIFVKLLFMKPIFDKHLPSSTLPITMVVDNSMFQPFIQLMRKELVIGQVAPNFNARITF